MKMLCFLARELSNSATYFSTFADVSTATMNELDGTFGSNGNETWKPWKYENRVDIANQVDKFKKSLAKQKISESTRRTKITNFIAQRHSRQVFKPAVGKLIDRAHVDPLHLKNNACALVHRQLLNEVIAMSKLSNDIKFFLQVSPNSHFHRYVTAMRKWGLPYPDWLKESSSGLMKPRPMASSLSIVLLGRTPGCFCCILCL